MEKWIASIFRKKKAEETVEVPPMPAWETVVEIMYDRDLDKFGGEVIRVIYAADRSMRYVILKNGKGFLTYRLEKIYPFSEDEWQYVGRHASALPAMWEQVRGGQGKSIFSCEADLLGELTAESAYKLYFEPK